MAEYELNITDAQRQLLIEALNRWRETLPKGSETRVTEEQLDLLLDALDYLQGETTDDTKLQKLDELIGLLEKKAKR